MQNSLVAEYEISRGIVSGGGGHGVLDHFDGYGCEGLGVVVFAGFGGGVLGAEAACVFLEAAAAVTHVVYWL